MDDIKNTVAKNLTKLRQLNNMTQLELAEKLNYSDKTVSKWERAESTPDISVLVKLTELFGVTLDTLVKSENIEEAVAEPKPTEEKNTKYNYRIIAVLSESTGWIIAVAAFIITTLVLGKATFQWLYFAYALPVALVIKLVFNSIWFNPRHNYYIISALMWSMLFAVHITFLYFGINVALIYLLGAAGQFVIIMWSFVKKRRE